jgi:hypothetical protein
MDTGTVIVILSVIAFLALVAVGIYRLILKGYL